MTRRTRVALCVGSGLILSGQTALIFGLADAGMHMTNIYTDDSRGAIVFLINGKEQGRIDGTGVHINGDITYAGSLTDIVTYDALKGSAGAGVP